MDVKENDPQKNYSHHALIVGATGFVGRALLLHLAELSSWRVTALCRTPEKLCDPGGDVCSVLASVDLSGEPAQILEILQTVPDQITHIFYCPWSGAPHSPSQFGAHGQIWHAAKEESELNLRMLENLVSAAVATQARALRRIILLEGSQWYGAHLGPWSIERGMNVVPRGVANYKTPFEEDDERPCACWYMDQQDMLAQRLTQLQQQRRSAALVGELSFDLPLLEWTALRPNHVIGSGAGSPMNLGTGLAALFALFKESGTGTAPFPGTPASYDALTEATSALLLCQGLEWAATAPSASNQAFNLVNGDCFRWRYMWPRLAAATGLVAEPPPAGGRGPLLVDFVQKHEKLWSSMCTKYGLVVPRLDLLLSADFLDTTLKREYDFLSSMNKARAAGFDASADTAQTFLDLWAELSEEHVVPPLLVEGRAARRWPL